MSEKFEYIVIDTSELYEKFIQFTPPNEDYDTQEYIKMGVVEVETKSAIGIAVFSIGVLEIDIDHLYVVREYQYMGIEEEILDLIQRMAYDEIADSGELVEINCVYNSSEESLDAMFKGRDDMDVTELGDCYSFTWEDIGQSKMLKSICEKRNKDTSMTSLPEGKRKYFMGELIKMTPFLDGDRFMGMDEELCQIVVDDNNIQGYMFVRIDEDNNINIDYAYCRPKQVHLLPVMLANLCYKAFKRYKDSIVKVTMLKDTLDINKILPDIRPYATINMASWNWRPHIRNEK